MSRRPDARRFETRENNYAARLGLGAAVDYALAIGPHEIEARCDALSSELRQQLTANPGVTLHDLGRRHAAIVSFSVARIDAADVKAHCSQRAINITTSSPSSILLDATTRGLPDVVRASPHYYNSEDEIARFVSEIEYLARRG